MGIGIVGLWDYTLEDAATEIWELLRGFVRTQTIKARINGTKFSLYPSRIIKEGCMKLAFEPNEFTTNELIKEIQKIIEKEIKAGLIDLSVVAYFPKNT